MENKKVLFGVITGLLAGTAIGLLLAPNKGEDTRHRLLESAKNLKLDTENLKPTLEKINEFAKVALDTITEYAAKYLHKPEGESQEDNTKNT